MVYISRKRDPAFVKLLKDNVTLDSATGELKFNNIYASFHVNIGWRGKVIQIPYSHIVWLLTHGDWPKPSYHLHHIDENPFNNKPDNLEELTEPDNQAKRRGRMVYRSYGTGKYGYGFNVDHDSRDGRYYIRRYLSRGHGNGDLKTPRKSLGGFDTLQEAKQQVDAYIEEIKQHGLDHMPEAPNDVGLKKLTKQLNEQSEKFRELRLQGHTVQQIANMTGVTTGAVYKRVRDMNIDGRVGAAHAPVKLNEEKVREIRKLAAEGIKQTILATQFGVSKAMISQIIKRTAWTHVE